MGKRRRWSQETVDKEIVERLKKGLSLTPLILKREDDMLLKQGAKYYGSWRNALVENSLNPDEWYLKKYSFRWTKEEVDKGIIDRVGKGLSLAYTIMKEKEEDYSLYNAAFYVYGSWKVAIEENGFNYEDYELRREKIDWTKDIVIKEINKRLKKGLSLNPTDVKNDYSTLLNHAIKLFGDWISALTASGIDYNDWYKQKPKGFWTEEVIIEELLKRKREGKSLSERDVDVEDAGLVGAVKRFYGPWSKGLLAIGENPNDHLRKSGRKKK